MHDIEQLPADTLAYIGDGAYELRVRQTLLGRGTVKAHTLHYAALRYTPATAQSRIIAHLQPSLTDTEAAVFRRGRNTRTRIPRNVPLADYRNATGFEAMLGYLHLSGQASRMYELIERGMAYIDETQNNTQSS